MSIMSVSEWRKKKEKEKEQGTVSSSAASTAASTQTTTGGESGKLMSPSEWKAKKATTSLEGWGSSANSLLEETQKYFGTWHNTNDEDGAYSSLRERRSSLLAQADSWRKQYADNEEAVSYINSVVSALSGLGYTAKDYFDYYSQLESDARFKNYDSKTAKSGWDTYIADKDRKQQEETEKPWYEKLLGYLGNASDTTLPGATMSQVVNYYRDDTSYREPSDSWDSVHRDAFGYLYAIDPEEAWKYAQEINDSLSRQEKDSSREKITEKATANFGSGVGHTVAAIGGGALGLADYLNDLAEYAGRGTITEKGGTLSPFEYSQAVTGGLSQHLNEQGGTLDEDIPIIGGRGWGDVYGFGISAAQSMVGGHVMGRAGALISFFGSAAAGGIDEAKSRGATDEQALAFGTVSGAAEALTELVPIDNLLNMGPAANWNSLFANLIKQGGEEFLGEGANAIITSVADYLTFGDKSNYEVLKRYYMEELNFSEEDAANAAFTDIVEDVAFDALGGFVTGTFSAGVETGIQNGIQNISESQYYRKTYGDSAMELVQEGLESAEGSLSHQLAVKYQQKMDNGGTLTGAEIHRLIKANEQQFMAEDTDYIRQAAADRLTELGESENVAEIADILAKQATKQKLTKAEKQTLRTSVYGERVANELNPDSIRSGEYTTAWAEQIDTNRINAEEYSRILEAAQLPQEAEESTGEQAASKMTKAVQAAQVDTVEATAANDQQITGKLTGKESLQVAEDGVTRQASTGKEVTPQKIVSIEGGKAMIQTDSGTIAADDIQFGTGDADLLWRSAASFNGINAAGANGIIRAYQSGQPVATYLHGATQEFQNGYYNMESGGEYADKLTPMQRSIIYELGKKAAGENTAKAQAIVKKSAAATKRTGVTGKVHFERNGRTFDQKRETALKTMEQLSSALGVEFYVYESYKNEAGQLVYKDASGTEVSAPNGYYDPKDGSIHIDLNAGAGGKGTMLFTIAHELTHFIKQWSPAKFKVLANFLVKQYSEQGVSVNKLVDAQIAKAKKNGRELSWDAAYEEVVADSMEAMLTDGNVVQVMADLKQQDKTLWQKICDWFKDLAADLKAVVDAYKGYKPDSAEGKMIADMQDIIVILESLYADALVDASENYQAASGTQKNTTREGGVDSKYSIREGMTEEERYEELKDKKITVRSDNRTAKYADEIGSLEALETKAKSKAEKIIKPLAKKLGIINTPLSTTDVETEFLFTTSGGLAESMHKQLRYGGSYVDFAKTLINLDHVLETAVLIEAHGDKYAGTARANEHLEAVYVLFGAFRDGKNIIPVQMEIKKSSDVGGRLYLTVAMTKIEADVVGSAPGNIQAPSLVPASEYSLAEIFSKINPQDKHFLKYLPDGFLSDEQIKAKTEALEEDASRIAGYKKEGDPAKKFPATRPFAVEQDSPSENVQQPNAEVKEKFSDRDDTESSKLYEQYRSMLNEIAEIDEVTAALEDSAEYKRFIETIKTSTDLGESFLIEYTNWDRETRFSELKKKAREIAKEANTIYKRYQAALSEEENAREKQAIIASGLSENDFFIKSAVKEFGYTPYFYDAGYVIPNGKMLNFSGEKGRHYGTRGQDHRAIGTIFSGDMSGSEAMVKFMGMGNIRIMPETPGIDLTSAVEPTKEQYSTIKKFVREYGSKERYFAIDITDENGRVVGNYEYDGYVNADRVVNDIKYYFENGTVREQSAVTGFLYSDRDSDGNALSEEQQEYFKDSKVRDDQGRLLVMYHGTPNGGFTKFRSGTYFTQNPGYADVYQNPGASSISTKRSADTPMTYKVYLDIKKPFDTRNPKERKIFQQEFYRKYGTGTPLADSGLPDWVDGMDLQEFIEEMEYDYDGLILDEGGVGGYGDEVVSRGLSYVVFSPEQVKNVDNKTPTDDPDIRYSERDPELERVNRVLEKENTELKHDINYLKELLKLQRKVTGGTKFTKSSMEAAAGQLMKYASAKGDKAELVKLLNGLYEYIAKGEELTWEGVKEMAQPAVDWLQDHVSTKKQLDSYAQEVLQQIRGSRIYLDEQQKKEVAYQYGSFNEFRKRAMGSVIITDNASTSLDSQWQEWSSMYPDIFDAEISSNDMPAALMDAFDTLRGMSYADSYGYDGELASQDLLRQVYDSYWNVSTLYTVADKAQKEINKLKYEHTGRMATLKKYHREKAAQLKQEHREALQKVKEAERERFDKKLQETQNRYQESRKKGAENRRKAEARRKIRRTVMDLKKILNRGDKKRNVKEDMKDLVAEALRSADILFTDNYSNEDMVRDGVGTDMTPQEAKYMTEAQDILAQIEGAGTAQERREAEERLKGKLDYRMGKLQDVFTRERTRLNKTKVSEVLGNLADVYASLENSEYDYVKGAFDENVHQYLTMLRTEVGGTIVKDMSLKQMEELHKAYTMVLTTVRNANRMFAANLKQTREQLGSQTIYEVMQAGGEHGLWLPGEDKVNAFSWNNQKPVYAFERIGSDTLKKLFENTRAGEDSWAQDMAEAREYYLERTRKYKYDAWDFTKQYNFTSTSGIDFSLNLEQIMSLYAYSKREQAHDHLMKGGFVFDGNTEVQVSKMGIKVTYLNKTAKAHNVSPEILGDIVSKLTKEQRAFVDEMQDYLSTTMGEKGNEVSMQMYGVKLFNEKHYFPLRSAGQYMERAKEADLKKEQGQISIVNSGFTKSTTPKSSNPVVLSGFMDVWASHVNEMSMYHSFVLPMEDFRRVYNYSSPNMETGQSVSVNSVIQDAYGEAATKYIDQLYRDLNGGAVSDPREIPAKALMGKFKKAAVFSSLSVVVQQPSAIGRAFAIVDPKYFVGGKVDSKRHKALWAELKQYAPVAAIKEMGYFDTGMGKSAQDFITGKEYGTIKEKAAALFTDEDYRDELLSKAPALADELTWCAIWEAVKRETKAKNKGMSVTSEEFLQIAGKRFTEVITKTQVYDSVLSRSANMRSKGALMSMWTAFMAEPTTTINMVEDALRKGKKGDKKYRARAMGAVLSSIILNSALVSLVYAMRDDDEDETFLEKYAQSFATEILDGINPLTYYPVLKDVWSALQGFDIERSDMSLITSLAEALTKLVQVLGKDTDDMDEDELAAHNKNLANAWWGVVDSVTALGGVPVKNVRRDINGAINMVKTIAADLTDRDTSWGSLLDNTWDDVKNTIPVVGWFPDATAADKLYKATVSGDTAYQKRLASAYSTESSLNSAIRKGLRSNDSRIWEAAIAWNGNDLETYKRLAKEIIAEGNFSQDNVVMAIQAEATALAPDDGETTTTSKAKGYFTAEKFAVAIAQGNDTMAAIIKADIIETAQKNGKTEEEAEKSFTSSAKSNMKEQFFTGEINENQAIDALTTYCGYEQEDAEKTVGEWTFESEYGFTYSDRGEAYKSGAISADELRSILVSVGGKTEEEAMWQVKVYDWQNEGFDIDSNQKSIVIDYETFCEPAGIDKNTYFDTYLFYNVSGEEGVAYSKTVECMPYIDSLPLSSSQKTALALCWWSESTVNKYKLW